MITILLTYYILGLAGWSARAGSDICHLYHYDRVRFPAHLSTTPPPRLRPTVSLSPWYGGGGHLVFSVINHGSSVVIISFFSRPGRALRLLVLIFIILPFIHHRPRPSRENAPSPSPSLAAPLLLSIQFFQAVFTRSTETGSFWSCTVPSRITAGARSETKKLPHYSTNHLAPLVCN